MNKVQDSYASLLKFGRVLEGSTDFFAEKHPELVVRFVSLVEKELFFTSIDNFFSLFPTIKRYTGDDLWDYESTLEMRRKHLGTHFGKGDLIHLLMTDCFENKYLRLLGDTLIESISNLHKQQTGRSLMMDWLESQGANLQFVPE